MKRFLPLTLAAACLLVLGLVVLTSTPAEASCTGKCEFNMINGKFCSQCVDAGYETGALCGQSGSCGCYFIQCAFALQTSASTFTSVEDAQAAGFLIEPEPAVQTPVTEGSCTPEEVLYGLPVGN